MTKHLSRLLGIAFLCMALVAVAAAVPTAPTMGKTNVPIVDFTGTAPPTYVDLTCLVFGPQIAVTDQAPQTVMKADQAATANQNPQPAINVNKAMPATANNTQPVATITVSPHSTVIVHTDGTLAALKAKMVQSAQVKT